LRNIQENSSPQIGTTNEEIHSGEIARLAKEIFLASIGKLFLSRESLISDIPTGDGNLAIPFFTV
jgi:hypothetical protein